MNATRSEIPKVPSSLQGFVDVDTLMSTRDDGIVAVISQRRKTGELTFGIFRVFADREGKTTFIPESLLESFREMVSRAAARMVELRDGGCLPFAVKR